MITATRRLEWDAAHRLLNHSGPCRFLHGHRYAAEVTVEARKGLDAVGRVVDFSVIKDVIGGWILRNCDHNVLLHEQDPILIHGGGWLPVLLPDQKPYVMPHGMNPTAENIGLVLMEVASNLLSGYGITVVKIRVWETPNCYADCTYIPPDNE